MKPLPPTHSERPVIRHEHSFTTTLRFNLNREDDRRALEYLRSADGYSSYSRAVIAAVNDHFSRMEKMKDDPYLETREKEDAFLRQIQETIEKSLSAAPALQLAQLFQNVQTQTAPQETSPEDDENLDAAMDFINSL